MHLYVYHLTLERNHVSVLNLIRPNQTLLGWAWPCRGVAKLVARTKLRRSNAPSFHKNILEQLAVTVKMLCSNYWNSRKKLTCLTCSQVRLQERLVKLRYCRLSLNTKRKSAAEFLLWSNYYLFSIHIYMSSIFVAIQPYHLKSPSQSWKTVPLKWSLWKYKTVCTVCL